MFTVEDKRGCQILWNLSYGQLQATCGCREQNLGPLQEKQVLWTAELSRCWLTGGIFFVVLIKKRNNYSHRSACFSLCDVHELEALGDASLLCICMYLKDVRLSVCVWREGEDFVLHALPPLFFLAGWLDCVQGSSCLTLPVLGSQVWSTMPEIFMWVLGIECRLLWVASSLLRYLLNPGSHYNMN